MKKVLRSVMMFMRGLKGAYVSYALSVSAVVFLTSSSFAYGWIAELYPMGAGFVPFMFVLTGIVSALLLLPVLFYKKLDAGQGIWVGRERVFKGLRIARLVISVLAVILFLYSVVLLFGSGANGFECLYPHLLLWGLLLGLPFVFVVLPTLSRYGKTVAVALICVALIAPMIAAYVPVRVAFEFSAKPLVLDIGDGTYSVVFATVTDSTASLVYTSADGKSETLNDSENGRLKVDRVHNFKIPRDKLDGGSYSVAAREVKTSLNANTEFGDKIESEIFEFKGGYDKDKGGYKDDLNILVASDVHDQPEKLVGAATNFEEPDLFIMMGDYASNYNNYDHFVINTLKIGADVTKSVIPAIYVRGNHEMYGERTDLIFSGLGLKKFYYQVERGDYVFTVLDSAEDAPSADENTANSVNTEGAEYKDGQLDWFSSLSVNAEKKHFVLTHIPEFADGDREMHGRFKTLTEELNVDMQLSAHEHRLALESPNETGGHGLPHYLLVDGGPEDGYGGSYAACFLAVRADGGVTVTAYNNLGAERLKKTIDIG